jgi:predicted aspartyl protease
MRIRSSLVFILLSVSCVCRSNAQACQNPVRGVSASTDHGLQIPISVHGGGIFVPVKINGGATFDFLLDTGFEGSVIDPSTATALHLQPAARHVQSAPGGQVETSSVDGVHRRVAGVPLPGDSLDSLDLTGFAPFFSHRVDGVLGYDFFEHYVVVLDYEHQNLTLCDPATFREAGVHPVAIDLASRQPYIRAEIEGTDGHKTEGSLEIDTGKVDPFSLNADFARKSGLFRDGPGVLAMKGVSLGGETQAWMIRGNALRFGDIRLRRPLIGVAEEDATRAGQLGYGMLRRFTIAFNYPQRQVFFRPNAWVNEPFEFDHAGFTPNQRARTSPL